ncbi:hypothetical protein [Sporosarcina psychrophila]|uniref:Uncharacterized protein n=1 Tax=Sporosarcina psychrophila TaxID=1476 RepID=A0ABV2KBZ1_SPOPS
MGKYTVVERVPMKNGVSVEPIEVKKTGEEIYPEGTVIQIKLVEKGKVTAKRSRQLKLIDLNGLIEPDDFDNNYGFDKLGKQMQQFKDSQYLEKQKYWQSEEGQERIQEMMRPEQKSEQNNEHGFGDKSC